MNGNENYSESEELVFHQKNKEKKLKLMTYELDELKVHIDSISFNLNKVYYHASERSRKEYRRGKKMNLKRG